MARRRKRRSPRHIGTMLIRKLARKLKPTGLSYAKRRAIAHEAFLKVAVSGPFRPLRGHKRRRAPKHFRVSSKPRYVRKHHRAHKKYHRKTHHLHARYKHTPYKTPIVTLHDTDKLARALKHAFKRVHKRPYKRR